MLPNFRTCGEPAGWIEWPCILHWVHRTVQGPSPAGGGNVEPDPGTWEQCRAGRAEAAWAPVLVCPARSGPPTDSILLI